MRLRTVLVNEPKTTLDVLESCNIKTDEDLLFSSDSNAALFRRLPPGSITVSDLERIREEVLKRLSAEGVSGDVVLKDAESTRAALNTLKWTTGHSEFDALLNAVGAGVIEVAGGKGSAKTSLVLNIALACLSSAQDNIVHWIDAAGEFSAERASKTLIASPWFFDSLDPLTSASSVLERLHVSLAFTAEAAHSVLTTIRSISASHTNPRRPCPVRLIIIDPITPLFAPHMTTASSEGQALVAAFMRELQDLAITQGLIALVTNNATNALSLNQAPIFASTMLKPALGLSLTFLTDTTLWLSCAARNVFVDPLEYVEGTENRSIVSASTHDSTKNMDNLFIAEILRSRSTAGRRRWHFSLSDGVVREFPTITPS
ncbi:hypothetical protein EW145_g5523 [Phellinidium pouzarii]|uniref:Rad51-like C-terminal domain-containing protein n=1 Tax=Phellinidium pouzarii TaxID=167371 RepID=A0A4S4L102_9AGAM|nr:hypothetical protein EW145_g5523 [Phellinidium pouzarii]